MADEQVGNNSYITMTPGSAVAGQLQNILTQRRLDARQDMIDKLNAQNTQSEMDYRAQNAKSLEEDRLSKVENRKAQELARRAGVMSPHMNLDPTGSDYKFLQQEAPSLIDPAQAGTKPMGPDDVGPEQPSRPPQFHGLPAQLDTERKQGLQDKLQALMSDPQKWEPLPDAQKEALYRAAYGASIPENVLRQKVGGKVLIYDDGSGKLTYADGSPATNVGPNDKIEHRPRAPLGPQGPAPTDYEGVETQPDGTTTPAIYRVGKDNTPAKLNFPGGFRVGGKAGTVRTPPAPKPDRVNQKSWDEFLALKSGLMDPSRPPDDRTLNLATTAAKNVISQATSDPIVQALLNDAWDHPTGRSTPASELLSKVTTVAPNDPSRLTDAQKADFAKTWEKLRLYAQSSGL